MSEEVTYATVKFSNDSNKTIQESFNLKRRDNHEVPKGEQVDEAENTTDSVERIVEVSESRPVGGHSAPWRVWLPISLISLMVNLVVLTGVGALVLKRSESQFYAVCYQEHIFSNRTCEMSQISQVPLDGNLTQCSEMWGNVSSELTNIKIKLRKLMKTINCTSKYATTEKNENDNAIHGLNATSPSTMTANCKGK